METILASNTPSLLSTSVNNGEIVALDIIRIFLSDFLEFIGQELSEGQKQQVCNLILKTYPHYRPEQIRLCFERIKSGKYGTIYGQVNGMVIMEFFLKFDIELDEEIRVIRSKESDRHKKEFSFTVTIPKTDDEEKAEAFRKMKEDILKIGKEKEVNEERRREIKIDAENKLIQGWIKEFDEIYSKTGKLSDSIKRIQYEGQLMNQIQFLEYKHEQFNQE